LVRGHTGLVTDVKFSPLRSNLLATASEDATVRLWEIPQGGLTGATVPELQKYSGHSKKVSLVSFHNSVAEIIASAGFDNTVQIWNICNGSSYSNLNLGDNITSMDWSRNGSLLGATTKAKVVSLVDPRANKVELQTKTHDSAKSQRVLFLDENHIFTIGFSRSNDREIRLFDIRNFTASSQVVKIDNQSGQINPYFDADLGLIYLPARGESNVKLYEFANSSVKFVTEFKSSSSQKATSFFPKRTMNYNKCEIARTAKLTLNTVEYVSFYFPKRNEGFDASLYPECITGEPALGVEEWLKGENKEPVRKNITSIETGWKVSTMNFEKKVEVEEKKTSESDNINKVNLIIYINFKI